MKRCLLQESRRSVHDTFNVLTGDFEGFDYSDPKICHGGKGGGGTNTVTQNSTPPPEIMAAYQHALSGAETAASAPLTQYGGNTVADFTPDQLSAFGTINNLQGSAAPFIQSAQNLIQQGTQPLWNGVQQFSPQAVQGYMSPYTNDVLNSQIALEQNQNAQQQQALKGNAISSGAWGGDRAGVASAILSGQQALANNATNSNILQQGYNQGLQEFNTQQQAQLGANEANAYLNQQGAFGLANLGQEALATGLTGASAQLQSGALQQQQNQANLNVPYEQFLQQQAYPFQTAQYYANIAEGIGSNSGGTGSGTTTTPGPSVASQIGGGLLGAAGLVLPFLLNQGGRVKGGFGRGGAARGFAGGGNIPPDLSISFVPNSSNAVHGAGPPRVNPPQPSQQQNGSPDDMALLATVAKALKPGISSIGGGMSPASAETWGAGAGMGMPFGAIAPQAAQASELQNFLGPMLDSGFGSFMRRGGAARYDDGGSVGGETPMTAMYAAQQQPTQSSNLNNMSEQQLQNYLLRLPIGSPQARTIQSVLQQKRTMPNVGTQAQGGFGSQAQPTQNQPMYGGYSRGGFADGGDADGIYIDAPPDPDTIQRRLELQSEMNGDGPVPTVSQNAIVPSSAATMGSGPPQVSAPPPTGGFGTQAAPQPVPTADVSDIKGDLNTRQHAEANPWLSLAKAGFAIAGGQSPYAMENIGRGAVAGIEDYAKQTREADTVNESVDKLLTEAKQHRETLGQEQQRESDLQNYRQAELGQTGAFQKGKLALEEEQLKQGKYSPSRDPNTGDLDLVNTRTGEIIHKPGSAGMSGADLQGLTGQAFLDKLKETNPAMAAQVKAMDEGDLNFPTGFAAKAPYWQQRLNALYQYHPEASQQTAAAYKQFMSGKLGDTTRSLNVATQHIALGNQLLDAMDNGDTKRVNQLGNALKTELGLSAAPTNFDAVKQVMAGEITKAATGASGALGDRDAITQTLGTANSPKLLKGALQTYQGLMGGQFHGLKQQYETQTGRKDYQRFLSPEALAAMAPNVPSAAIEALRKNPDRAAEFEDKFKVPASQFLGGQ